MIRRFAPGRPAILEIKRPLANRERKTIFKSAIVGRGARAERAPACQRPGRRASGVGPPLPILFSTAKL